MLSSVASWRLFLSGCKYLFFFSLSWPIRRSYFSVPSSGWLYPADFGFVILFQVIELSEMDQLIWRGCFPVLRIVNGCCCVLCCPGLKSWRVIVVSSVVPVSL